MKETEREREERLKKPIGALDAAVAFDALKPQTPEEQKMILQMLFGGGR